jgi:hypothetical protein
MNRSLTLVAAVVALSLTACSSIKTNDKVANQKLQTSFVAEGVKIETDCSFMAFDKSDCNIVAIEATGVTSTGGGTPNNLRTGMIRAGDLARAHVAHFINEEVSSTRVTNTIAKNLEKAKDSSQTNGDGVVVEMTDKEAANVSVRENSNDTAHQLTQTIRVNSRAILRGFRVVKQEVVGPQEVAVTIRWDLQSDKAAQQLRQRFGN